MPVKPPWATRDEEITAEKWNALVAFVLSTRVELGVNSGIEAGIGTGGVALRVPRVAQLAAGTATGGAIPSGTFASPGKGSAALNYFDGTSMTPDSITVDAYNITDKTIASGAGTILGLVDGCWFVLVPDSCSHLS